MNPSTAFATVFVDELIRNGVREAVLSPGSRSAPLAFALHAAAGSARLRLHVRIDERGAAFLALGLAKVSGRPVPVVTTSGTAAANLHPAVVEASHAGVPLLALTTDRPPELRGSGANQTIDQAKMYGDAVRAFLEVGTPEGRTGQNGPWRAAVCRAVAAALGSLTGDPGPVHLNLPLREPLVPDDDPSWPEFLDGRPHGAPWTLPAERGVLARPYSGSPRTLVLVGDASPEVAAAAVRTASEQGWPIVAESVSEARSSALAGGSLLLSSPDFLSRWRPDRVLVVGRPSLHRATQALLRDATVEVDVVAPGGRWADPGAVAVTVVPPSALAPAPGRVREEPESDIAPVGDPDFLAAWREAGRLAAAAIDSFLDEEPLFTGLHVAAAVAEALKTADGEPAPLLVLGSSSVVRDLDVAGTGRGETAVTVANRGAAGIDGVISTAVGAALAHAVAGRAPAYALVGDLTFLHDATGLMIGPDEPRPDLTIVVVNDNGGGIFATLEPGAPEHAAAFERIFGTPTGVDLAALCAATGTPHVRLQTRDELPDALAWRPGLRVVEIQTDRAALRRLHIKLRDAVSGAVAELG